MLVADLDDTETYFANAYTAKEQIVGGQKGYYNQAWEGFSSDEVYVRMRVEGDYAGLMDTVITKIGNHDLEPKFASMLPEPTVRHTVSWITSEMDGADYGCADKYVSLATANFEELVNYLWTECKIN